MSETSLKLRDPKACNTEMASEQHYYDEDYSKPRWAGEYATFQVSASVQFSSSFSWEVKVNQSRYRPGVAQRVPGS